MIQNEYETIYVTRPELPEDELTRLSEKLRGIIGNYEGSVLVWEDWGRRKMAYAVKKHQHGHYTYMNYVGPANLPRELERNIRIEDNMIRFLTVKLEDDVDPEERLGIAVERQRQRAEKLAQQAAEDEAREEARAARRGRDSRQREDDSDSDTEGEE